MYQDAQGNGLTTTSEAAAGHFAQAIADFLDYRTTPSARLKDALAEDPDFVLAGCFRACFLMMIENRAILPKVEEIIDRLRSHRDRITERERLHLDALEAWAGLDILEACRIWERLLAIAPRDILALKLHHTMSFYTGRSQVLRSAIAGILPAWDETIPGYSSVQGMYAYALEECGACDEAERWGREAVSGNPDDLWAIHAVGHVMDAQGRDAEGAAWLDYPAADWADRNPFKAHLWWHAALFHLALGDDERALEYHDELLCSVNSGSYVDVSNQASLLKRLEMRGVDVGERWHILSAHAETRIHDHILTFRDVHFCLALAADGKFDVAQAQLDSMAAFAIENKGWTAEVTKTTLIPLCEGIIAHEAGDMERACDILWPMRNDLAPVGGSHTQRDLFRQILEDAALRGDRKPIARCLISERLMQNPDNGSWQSRYGEILAGIGAE